MTMIQQTDEARAIAEAQPVIDVGEVIPDRAPTPGALVPVVDEPREIALIPRSDELTVLAQLAVTFAQAGLVPKALRGNPADVMLVLMTGRGLGIDPLVALRECHPIDGKVTVSPKLKLAIVRQRRLGSVWPDPSNNGDHATWHAIRADDPRETIYSATYSMDDAKTAGLAGKDNWKKYPRQMLQWRALGYLLDQAFGEVGTGLYSADELGAVTDDEGRAVIDVTHVEPLAGIEPPDHAKAKAEREAEQAANEVAPAEVLDAMKDRIRTLLPPAVQALAGEWSEPTERADGTTSPRLWPLKVLPVRQVEEATALIDDVFARAEAGEWGEWVGHGSATAPDSPQDAPEADPGPEEAPTVAGTQESDEDDVCEECVDGTLATFFTDDGKAVCDRHTPEDQR